MNISNLDLWVRKKEGLDRLTREDIENIQLRKLNCLLEKEKLRGGFIKVFPKDWKLFANCPAFLSRQRKI